MKDYEVYIFDLDGTITNTMTIWLELLRKLLIEFGISPPGDSDLIRYTHDWNTFIEIGLPEKRLGEFTKRVYFEVNKLLPDAPFHAEAYETLEALKNKKKRLAIFSTMDRPIFEPAMKHRNLYPLVEIAIAGTDVQYRKPHPAGLLKVLENLNIKNKNYDDGEYIGDKDTDVQAANNAGIKSVLFYPVEHQLFYDLGDLKKHKPTHIISDLKELLVN